METNPIDGYRDVHPWPYTWHYVQFDDALPVPVGRYNFLSCLDVMYDKEQVAVWTYENHWTHTEYETDDYWEYVLDVYALGGSGRDQMPPPLGDAISDYIVDSCSDGVRCVIWMHRIWTPDLGWESWMGEQGDFVDHIHVELDVDSE